MNITLKKYFNIELNNNEIDILNSIIEKLPEIPSSDKYIELTFKEVDLLDKLYKIIHGAAVS